LITKQSKKLNYKPNLTEFISQCEKNYYLILKILPFLDISKNIALDSNLEESITFCSESGYQLNFTIVERARYTTTMMLNLKLPTLVDKSGIKLMVRFYHDVKLLEVMDEIGPKALKPIIKNKNTRDQNRFHQHTDEKKQLNRFLGESLSYCIQKCKEI